MIKLLFLVLLLTAQASATEPFRLRVLCYNIHHAEGIDRKLDVPRIANVILSVSPDVVCLQEVDQNTTRTKKVDQPAELARLTKMEFAFGKNFDFQGGGYGNVVLSKFPITKKANTLLPSFDNGEQRGVLICDVQPKSLPHPLQIVCTHFDYRRDDRERVASAKKVNELIKSELPAILAGDFNDVSTSKMFAELKTNWVAANQKILPTVPVGKPNRQIDFIFSRPANRWKMIEVKVLDEKVASDHRAIFAVLELLPAN